MDLNEAIAEFDATETTLTRLESVWRRLSELTPQGIAFVAASPEGIEYGDLCRAFRDLANGLPKVAGFHIQDLPRALDDIAQNRLDARDLGFPEAVTGVESVIAAPGEAIREYRFRFNRERRKVGRDRMQELVTGIEPLLSSLTSRIERDREPITDPEWTEFVDAIREVERLAGSSTPRKGRWGDLRRHLAWGQGVDLHDIAEHDWPSVRVDINESLYADTEPMPVRVDDLAELVNSHPTGRLSTKLRWQALDDEGFERLVFNLITNAPDYDNPRWLTKTRAPDRGRDLSVERTYRDELSGVRHQRVIVSCKHWLTKSIDPDTVRSALNRIPLSEPPAVDALIIATSGRFTADAVELIDKHNDTRARPKSIRGQRATSSRS